MTRIGMALALAMFLSMFGSFAYADQVVEMIKKGGARANGSAAKLQCSSQGGNSGGLKSVLCPYYKANDNLTFQALYLINKIAKIEDALAVGNEDQAEVALGSFCRSKNGESLSQCFTRYKSFQALALVRIREAIGQNEDSVARLTSGRQEDGSLRGNVHQLEMAVERENYVPEVLTIAQMETEFMDGVKSGKIKNVNLATKKVKTQHGEWHAETVNPLKTKEHFVFKKDPVSGGTSKDKRKLLMYQRQDGRTQEDNQVTGFVDSKVKEIQASRATAIGHDEVDLIRPSELKTRDTISYESVRDSRAEIIGTIEGAIKNDGKASTGTAKTTQLAGATTNRFPAYDDHKVIERPKSNDTHYYIRYDLGQLLKDAQSIR